MISNRFQRYGHLLVALSLLGIVSVIGTIGYEVVEGWSFLDSFYMTVTTLATVGFQEVHALSPKGRIFTIFIVMIGVGTAWYTLSSLTQVLVGTQIDILFGRRRVEREIEKLKNHYIVGGYGRMGRLVCRELKSRGKGVVVVESDESARFNLDNDGIPYIIGNVTDDEVLLKAGVERAKSLVAAVRTDADNLYLVITARQLNPAIYIVSRSADEAAERKLIRAGANKVVSPYHIGALRMAQAVLRPAVVDFLEMTIRGEKFDLRMEGIHVSPSSPVVNVTLAQSRIREKLGLNIIALKRSEGEMVLNPAPETTIRAGDVLITVGQEETLTKLEEMLNTALSN